MKKQKYKFRETLNFVFTLYIPKIPEDDVGRRGGHICGITLLSVYPKETILVGAAHCYNKESKILSLFSITNVSYLTLV